jgi:uncharacterized protein YjdB
MTNVQEKTTMQMGFSKWIGAMAMGAAVLVAACSDDPVQPAPNPVAAEVEVTPGTVTLGTIGETETLTATVLDEDGTEIPDAPVAWSSDDEAVAVVDEEGVVEAVGEGVAVITAESGDASATVEVSVELDEGAGDGT